MEKDITFKQKKGGLTYKFELLENHFNYEIISKSGNSRVKIWYNTLGSINEKHESTDENTWLRNIGILWLLLGSLFELIPYFTYGVFKTPFWTTLGTICTLINLATKTRFSTIYTTDMNRANILKDKQHDIIRAALFDRKNKILRERLLAVNKDTSESSEIQKYDWLLEEKVITQSEYDAHIKDVRETYGNKAIPSPFSIPQK